MSCVWHVDELAGLFLWAWRDARFGHLFGQMWLRFVLSKHESLDECWGIVCYLHAFIRATFEVYTLMIACSKQQCLSTHQDLSCFESTNLEPHLHKQVPIWHHVGSQKKCLPSSLYMSNQLHTLATSGLTMHPYLQEYNLALPAIATNTHFARLMQHDIGA